jgi:hypothetical protein
MSGLNDQLMIRLNRSGADETTFQYRLSGGEASVASDSVHIEIRTLVFVTSHHQISMATEFKKKKSGHESVRMNTNQRLPVDSPVLSSHNYHSRKFVFIRG